MKYDRTIDLLFISFLFNRNNNNKRDYNRRD